VNVFCLPTKNLKKHTFCFHRLKRLLVVQILEVTVYQENAEHIRLTTFHWQSEKVEMGGTCLGEQKSIQQKVVFNSCLPTKHLKKPTVCFHRLKRLLVVQILEVTVYQENAEHIRLITFH